MNHKGYYLIKTYGCQMNVHESEKLAGMLKSLGYEATNEDELADIIVFNTCAIRDGAEKRIFGHIGNVKRLKQQKPELIVAVCGCMTQIKGRVDIFKSKYPFVNIVFGTHNINEFKQYIFKYENYKQNIYEVWDKEKEISENVEMYRTSNYNAWLNIMYGCNNFCTFCIVPFVRGRERSRKIDDIINDAKQLISQGFKYITLLGQNVNSYGNDIKDKNVNFATLLKKLSLLNGDFKIKFMTSHPKDLSSEVIDVIASSDKISKYIHLPVQSGSNKILKLMNRNYTKEHYVSLIKEVREKIPNAIISTDIIVGFPNETEEDYLETYQLIKDLEYDGVFAFMYSPRTGTVAEKMDNQISHEIKRERVNKLLTLSKKISHQKTILMIGKIYNCIIESTTIIDGKICFNAITDSGKPIIVKDYDISDNIQLGCFYDIIVNTNTGNKLIGSLANARFKSNIVEI